MLFSCLLGPLQQTKNLHCNATVDGNQYSQEATTHQLPQNKPGLNTYTFII